MMVGRFFIREIKSVTPACTICGMLLIKAFTTEPIISGIAATMVVMISGRAWIRATSKSIPAWIICGIEPSTAVIIPSII